MKFIVESNYLFESTYDKILIEYPQLKKYRIERFIRKLFIDNDETMEGMLLTLNSLEELIELQKVLDHDIVITKSYITDEFPVIEIDDDFR